MSEPTPKEGFVNVCLPFFPGFYESLLSSAIDHYEEREAEYMAEREIPEPKPEPEPFVLNSEEMEQGWYPEHLRISAQEYCELFMECCSYQLVYQKIARFWVEAFDWWCKENIGTPEGSFVFETMVSPREYNFTTDRVFAWVPESVIEALFSKSEEREHKLLAECIKKSFTSYDGFISSYSNRLDEWLEKPVLEWDHNELMTLVQAAIRSSDEWSNRWDFSMALYHSIFSGNNEDGEAFDAGMDWPKFEEKVRGLRAEKAAEHEEKTK